MKTIKLDHTFAQQVLAGTRRIVWKIFDEKHLSVGDEIQFIEKVDPDDEGTWHAIGNGTIQSVTEKCIRDITEKDYKIDTTIRSKQDIIDNFREQYGPLVTQDTPIKIVQFSFIAAQNNSVNDVTKATKITEVKLYTDGGSRGNPGPSALGYVVKDINDELLESGSKYIGLTTNNQAEYQAVRAGLAACAQYTNGTVSVFSDSQLVANQMNGIYKIKNRELWPIHQAIKQLCEHSFDRVSFTYIPREYNKEADAMVNEALDAFANSK